MTEQSSDGAPPHERQASFALVSLFIASIFLGSVSFPKITLPFALFVLPLLFVAYPPLDLLRLRNIPVGAYFLLALGMIALAQLALGLSIQWKSDLTIWMPVGFGGVTILALRAAAIPDRLLGSSLIAGGVLNGAVMVGVMIWLPPNQYPIAGQNAWIVETTYADQIAKDRARQAARRPPPTAPITAPPSPTAAAPNAPAPPAAQPSGPSVPPIAAPPPATREAFAPALSEDSVAYYRVKNLARSMLGMTNYIAVFFVFAFIVALFSCRWLWAAVLAALSAATLARFGFAFMLLATAAYVLYHRGFDPWKLSMAALAVTVMGLVSAYLLRDLIAGLPGTESLAGRLRYWTTGLEVAAGHPTLGAARSFVLEERGYSITWHPHNSVLSVAASFGLIGLAAYLAYVVVVVRAVAAAAASSPVWAGVLLGVMTMLAWSMVEIIVLTPAFELLFASLYALARNRSTLVVAGQGAARSRVPGGRSTDDGGRARSV